MAEYITAPADHFYALPDNIPFDIGALVEPLAVGWHAVHLSPFKSGDVAVVVGGGPIGIAVIQVLKLQRAKKIIVVEPVKNRQRLASEFGASDVLDPGEKAVPDSIRSLTHGVGADVVFDTAGVERALNNAIPACRTHGSIVNIAVWEKGPHVDLNELMYNEVNFMGAALYDEQAFEGVIRALHSGEL
jgi:threonine dehydrogenase-like Zn-dependent dehydrogenase